VLRRVLAHTGDVDGQGLGWVAHAYLESAESSVNVIVTAVP
jgi:hypothetical protein